jgi:6-phospho-3-hexuloisomerase
MLTIFANMKIDSTVRLQHMKDSFLSFDTISDNWLINIRGKFRNDALGFLREKLGNKMVEFEFLDDSRGWAKNALEMLKKAEHDYILLWNEDHLNIAPQEIYSEIIKDMKADGVDSMFYSFWYFGQLRKGLENLPLNEHEYIDTIELTKKRWEEARKNGHTNYLISMAGIFKKDFIEDLFKFESRKFPGFFTALVNISIGVCYKFVNLFRRKNQLVVSGKYFDFINKYLFRYRLTNFSKETPFNLERNPKRVDILPIKIAIPKQELFVNIDCDCGFDNYSLIQRGIYKDPTSERSVLKKNVNEILEEIKKVFTDISEEKISLLTQEIISAQKVFLTGAGRVGLATKGLAMRLGHLGLNTYMIGDMNVPAIKERDLLLISSGSGETQTIYDIVVIAKNNGSRIALVTGNLESRMAKLADTVVEIKAPSKVKEVEGFKSIQPMTTLNEQCLSIFFDALVLKLMEELGETHDTMWGRHSNLE